MEDDATGAEEAGADLIIGRDRISEIAEGDVDVSDYDFCVSARSMLPHLSTIKKQLRDKFPTAKRGSAGEDVGLLIQKHKIVKKYRVLEPESSICNCIIGNLGLSDDQIEDNLSYLVEDVCKHKPLSQGPLIKKINICGFRLDSYEINFQSYIREKAEEEVEEETRSELVQIEDELRKLRAS